MKAAPQPERRHEIGVWLWPLDAPPPDLSAGGGRSDLSRDEQARAARFLDPVHAARFIAARSGLRMILARYLDAAPGDVRFVYGPHGKPSLAGPHAGALHFNLSHTGDLAALAVCRTARVGIDIERWRDVSPLLADRFFAPAEQQTLAALPPGLWTAGFFRCWTSKEAVAKALGSGLQHALAGAQVEADPRSPARLLRLDGSEDAAAAWTLEASEPRPRLSLAVAAETPPGTARIVVHDDAAP